MKFSKIILFLLTITIFSSSFLGCGSLLPKGDKGDKGDIGLIGPMGPTGEAGVGVSLINVYTGTIASDGSTYVNVPELKGNLGRVYILAYWSFASSPTTWTLMSDGWLDDTTKYARICSVSWTTGTVYLNYMTAGDHYMILVYYNN